MTDGEKIAATVFQGFARSAYKKEDDFVQALPKSGNSRLSKALWAEYQRCQSIHSKLARKYMGVEE